MRNWLFFLICVAVGALVLLATHMVQNDYAYFADSGCRSVRGFFMPGQPVATHVRSWGAVKAIYR